jgi:hypothetical protein
MAAKMIGSINCFSASPARFGRKAFVFDGTIKGLTFSAVAAGAAGGKVSANFGGGFREYEIASAPHDTRAGGYWAQRA